MNSDILMFQVSILSQQVAELEGQLDRAHRDKSSLTNQLEDFLQKFTSQEEDNTKVRCVDSESRPLSQYQDCIIYRIDFSICACPDSCFFFFFSFLFLNYYMINNTFFQYDATLVSMYWMQLWIIIIQGKN